MADLKVRLLIEDKDGQIKPFTGFTDSQLDAINKRLSRTLSEHFTRHPDEFKKIMKNKMNKNSSRL